MCECGAVCGNATYQTIWHGIQIEKFAYTELPSYIAMMCQLLHERKAFDQWTKVILMLIVTLIRFRHIH